MYERIYFSNLSLLYIVRNITRCSNSIEFLSTIYFHGAFMNNKQNSILRKIPSVDYLLGHPSIKITLKTTPRSIVLKATQQTLSEIRQKIKAVEEDDKISNLEVNTIIDLILNNISILTQPSLRPVINATGIIIHTNLGRSILPKRAIDQIKSISSSYSNLEYDLETGQRGSRYVHVEEILKELTGAEASMVVNNNAAAVLIALDTLANGKEAVISRGQLIEIGGSFRMPEVMKKGGARMVEVGTTNKTTIKDYESAIGPDTSLLLKVHTSNFQIIGFTEDVNLDELVALGRKKSLCVMEDLGSGCLLDFSSYGLKKEPTVQESVSTGVDIVTFSGDKMLGGPQCGIILGKKDIISEIKGNQLNRALRIDKLTLIALQETLYLYRDKQNALRNIPSLKAIRQSYKSLCLKAERLLNLIGKINKTNFIVDLCDGFSQIGGGAMPLEKLHSRLLCIIPVNLSASYIAKYLRSYTPPIITRLEKNKVLLDPRTIQERELVLVSDALKGLSRKH